jgi:hypothetical protein
MYIISFVIKQTFHKDAYFRFKTRYELSYESQFPITNQKQLLLMEEELNLKPSDKKNGQLPLQIFLRCSQGAGLIEVHLTSQLSISVPLRIGDYGSRHVSIIANLQQPTK